MPEKFSNLPPDDHTADARHLCGDAPTTDRSARPVPFTELANRGAYGCKPPGFTQGPTELRNPYTGERAYSIHPHDRIDRPLSRADAIDKARRLAKQAVGIAGLSLNADSVSRMDAIEALCEAIIRTLAPDARSA